MVFPKRRLKTTSTQCTRERKPIAGGGGNTNATTEVHSAAAAATGIITADAAADHAAAAYTTAAAITATAWGLCFQTALYCNYIGPHILCHNTFLQSSFAALSDDDMAFSREDLVALQTLATAVRCHQEYSLSQRRIHSRNTFRSRSRFLFHPRMRNLVILDDLMSTASKDSRIDELFTEGSHHRNLSVVAINQNLYYNKDPSQRRNCHYMVLFNNPVDKQQIMTLSRQMYPENSQHLLRHFKEATSKPYGYLRVDLKPTKPEHLCMRTDIMNTIKPKCTGKIGHFQGNSPNIQTFEGSVRPLTEIPQLSQTTPAQLYNNEIESEDMPSCDDCGIVFENMHDLQRHVKKWCPINVSLKRKRDDEEMEEDQPPQKWIPFKPEEK